MHVTGESCSQTSLAAQTAFFFYIGEGNIKEKSAVWAARLFPDRFFVCGDGSITNKKRKKSGDPGNVSRFVSATVSFADFCNKISP